MDLLGVINIPGIRHGLDGHLEDIPKDFRDSFSHGNYTHRIDDIPSGIEDIRCALKLVAARRAPADSPIFHSRCINWLLS